MARTTNEFGGGEIVPSIEAITGIQAPVMADFEAVPFGTVNHEHGERRQIQKLTNNLKSSSGIERIPFNGIDELDTEQGPNGEAVHALNTGDSRIRFINGTRQWQLFADANSAGTQPGTAVRLFNSSSGTLNVVMGEVEITFFGTGLNILSWTDTSPANWVAFVDGSMTGTQISPNNMMINFTPPAQFDVTANRAIKVNQVVPVVSGLSAGIHTVRIEGREHGVSGGGASTFPLFGCEIINENAGITQQPGADFDGRVELLSGTTFPIKPTNSSSIASVNSRTGVSEAFTGTTGARVLNYLTSGGQLKQSFDIADEAPGFVASTQTYTLALSAATSVTLPTSATSFMLSAYGAGGGGGGGRFDAAANSFFTFQNAQGGGGGAGGGLVQGTYTRDTSTQAETLSIARGVGGTAGSGGGNFGNGNNGANGEDTTVTFSSTTIATAPGGAGGNRAFSTGSGSAPGAAQTGPTGSAPIAFTGWTVGSTNTTIGGTGAAGGQQLLGTATPVATSGGTGGNVGGFGNTPLTGSEGQGGTASNGTGGNGTAPGAGAAGGGANTDGGNSGAGQAGGAGAVGRVYLLVTATIGLTNTSFGVTAGEFTANPAEGGDAGGASAKFGNAAFDTNRLNQEVIRRINFREFGANNQFATLSSSTNAAFTLDDGTTTLSGNGVETTTRNGIDTVLTSGTNNFFTLTFVGTGLDIFEAGAPDGTTVGNGQPVSIDGLSVGNYIPATLPQITPIVSGLAYGTHTVRFTLPSTGANINPNVVDFIIYGPKKPEIPTLDVGSLELSDYNIMADFAADTANNINSVSKGILGKAVARECILNNGASGTARWSTELSTDGSSYGSRLNETGDGSTREELFYTFYGDAFSMRMKSNTVDSASTHEFYLDGTRITRTNAEGWNVDNVIFLNNTDNGTSTPSQAWPASGDDIRFDGGDTTKIIFPPSFNMGLGVHTIRIRHSANSPAIFYGMEVGTPIHINDDNLKVGSEGLNNLTIDPVVEEDEQVVLAKLGEAKAWIDCMPTGSPRATHNISAVIRRGTGQFTIYFDKPFKSGDYVVIGTSSSSARTFAIEGVGNKRANSVNIVITRNDGANLDESFYAAFFGELIDE